MEKDMLTTFDDDALDQVSGGVDHGQIAMAVGQLVGEGIKDAIADAANRFERWGEFFTNMSTALRS